MKKFNLKNLFVILTLGGLWGILEATLGTVLHFSGVMNTFLSSSIIMVPIAYIILSIAYKNTRNLRSIFFTGLVAGTIKLSAFLVPGIAANFVINPAVSIVIETLAFGLAIYVIKPESMISYKGIAVVLISTIIFRLSFTLYQLATVVPFGSASFTYADGVLAFNEAGFVKFNITQAAISLVYTLAIGCGYYGVRKAAYKKNINFNLDSVKKVAFSPVMSVMLVGAAIALTVIL